MSRAGLLGAALAATLALAGCDSEPSGPGHLDAVLTAVGEPPGGAVLVVTGPGIQGVSPAGSSRVYGARVGVSESWRVVLVGAVPGELHFRVDVDDVAADPPVASVLQVVDGQNQPFAGVAGFEVRFSR